jgi:hypothetical protein
LTTSTPSAVPATAMVMAVAYPSARIISSALGGSAVAAHDADVPHPGAGRAIVLPAAPASPGIACGTGPHS